MMQSERKLHPQLQNLFTDVKPAPRPNYDTGSMVVAAFAALSASVIVGVVMASLILWLLFGK